MTRAKIMLFSFSLQQSARVAALSSGGSILHLSIIYTYLIYLVFPSFFPIIFVSVLAFAWHICRFTFWLRCPTNWDFMMVAIFIITLTPLLLRIYSFGILSFFVIFSIDNSKILLPTEIVFVWCSSRLFHISTSWLRV